MTRSLAQSTSADKTVSVESVIADLIRWGARYDAAPLFPSESLKCLEAAGWLRQFAPPESGGERYAGTAAGYLALYDRLRQVGRGDLSTGRLFEGHVNVLQLFGWYGTPAQKRWLNGALSGGAVFGIWASEPPAGVRMESDGDHWRLTGEKWFASGAGGLDYALVTALAPDGFWRMVLVPANDPQRADISGWRVRGMRASVSGRYDLNGLRVTPECLLGQAGDYDREPRFTAGAWRFTAVQLGGIEALLAETRQVLMTKPETDALQRAQFAQAYVACRTAGLWVRKAALLAAAEAPEAADMARLTRGVVERAALDVMETAARLTGTRSAFDGERIDRIIRDLSLYLRQATPDQVRDQAISACLAEDVWEADDRLW